MVQVLLPPTWDAAWQHPTIPPTLGLGPDLTLWTRVALAEADPHQAPFCICLRPLPDQGRWEITDDGYIMRELARQVPAAADPAGSTIARWWALAIATRFGLRLDSYGMCGGEAATAHVPRLLDHLRLALHTIGNTLAPTDLADPALLPDGDFSAAVVGLGRVAARTGHPSTLPCPRDGIWHAWAVAWETGFQEEQARLARLAGQTWPVLTWGRAVTLIGDPPASWVTLTLAPAAWHRLLQAFARYEERQETTTLPPPAVRWIARSCPHHRRLDAVWLEIALADEERATLVLALPPRLFPALPEIAAATLVELIPAQDADLAAPGGLTVRLTAQPAGCLVDVPVVELRAIHDHYFSTPPSACPGA
jgi:hypothetical protein